MITGSAQELCSDIGTIILLSRISRKKKFVENGSAKARRINFVKFKTIGTLTKYQNEYSKIYSSPLIRITVEFYV